MHMWNILHTTIFAPNILWIKKENNIYHFIITGGIKQ